MAYNIHKGVGADRRYRLERIAAVIKEESPDLICLQEVDRNVRRSRRDDQPALLAEKLGVAASLYQLNVPRNEGGYGNLVLSRWPFQQTRQISLNYKRRAPRRPTCGDRYAGGAVAPRPHPLRPVGTRTALAGDAVAGTAGVSSGGEPADAHRGRFQRLAQRA